MTYRILVTGSREWNDGNRIVKALDKARCDLGHPPWRDMILVHGKCPKGADKMAGEIGRALGMQIEEHPADWSTGNGAGFARNKKMVDLGADICLAFIRKCFGNRCKRTVEHGSHGAVHCSTEARRAGIKTRVYKDGW